MFQNEKQDFPFDFFKNIKQIEMPPPSAHGTFSIPKFNSSMYPSGTLQAKLPFSIYNCYS
jgi:hypothetical protein